MPRDIMYDLFDSRIPLWIPGEYSKLEQLKEWYSILSIVTALQQV